METFQQRLKRLREEKKLTQEKLADMIQMNRGRVIAWEKGGKEPSIHAIQELSKVLGVSADYLLCINDYRKNENENICEQLGLSEGAVEYLRSCNQIDKLYRQQHKEEVVDEYYPYLKTISMILESKDGEKLMQGIMDYIHPRFKYSEVSAFDDEGNQELIEISPTLLETLAKEEISKALYELKKEYERKENDGKDS